MVENTLVFVDNGFFKLVKKEFEKKIGKRAGLFKSFRNICKNEGLNLKHLFFYSAPPYQSEDSSEKEINLRKNPHSLGCGLILLWIFSSLTKPKQTPHFSVELKTEGFVILKRNYDNLSKLLNYKKWVTLREGRCQRLKIDGDYKYSQKGVDILLTIDLMRFERKFANINKIILIACDSDFVPVIEQLKKEGVEIILYTYFDRKRNSSFSRYNELLNICSKWRRFKVEDFE